MAPAATVPGCGRTTGLEIHHIWHWEDGGPTESWNLLTRRPYHHGCHHRGTLGIEGNADCRGTPSPGSCSRTGGVTGSTPSANPSGPPHQRRATSLAAVASAVSTVGMAPHRYVPPTGERLDRSQFHLREDPEPPGCHRRARCAARRRPPASIRRPPGRSHPGPTAPRGRYHHGPHPPAGPTVA